MIYIHSIYHIWRERQSISNCSWKCSTEDGTAEHGARWETSDGRIQGAPRAHPRHWVAARSTSSIAPHHTVSHLRSQAQSPFVQGAAATLGGGDLALPEQSPVVVDGNGHVDVLVSVDAHDDLFLCQAGLGHRFPPRTMASHRWDGRTRLSGDLWSGSYQVTFVPSVPRGDSGEGRQISRKAHVASGRRGQTLPGTA
jgi:hypothetical protein